MLIRRLPVLREDIHADDLGNKKILLKYKREFNTEEYEKLKLGHLPTGGADNIAAIHENNKLSIYFIGASTKRCIYEVLLSPTENGATIIEVWESSQKILGDVDGWIGEILKLSRLSPLGASDWQNQAMPPEKTELEIDELFAPREFAHLMWGVFPLTMEDKWFAYSRGRSLYWFRSWSGVCIYEIHFEKFGEAYCATKLFVNANPKNSFDAKLAIRLLHGHASWNPRRYEILEY